MWGWAAAAALSIFAVAIIFVAVWERYRVVVVGVAAAAVVALGLVAPSELLPQGLTGTGSVIEWNALALLAGLLLFAALLGALGLPRWIALRLAARLRASPVAIYLALTALAFGLSMVLNALAVVLVLVPVALEISRELKIPPLPLLLTNIMAANLGGTATLVGNPPNLILGSAFGLSFSGFLEHAALPALAALAVTVLWFLGRVPRTTPASATSLSPAPALDRPHVAIALGGFAIVIGLLIESGPLGLPLWVIGVGAAVAALAIAGTKFARGLVEDFDWSTVVFLLFLFVLVGALEETGVVGSLAGGLASTGITNPFELGLILLWTLGLASSVVDNIPLAAVASPLIASLSGSTGASASPLAYASAIGLGVGGNGTPIGSISNVTGLAAAQRDGVRIGWSTYLKDGVPVMLLGLAAASAVWILVG